MYEDSSSFSWFPGGPALYAHHHAVHFASTFNPFPLLSVYIAMSSRQGLLLIQCFVLPGTTVSHVEEPLDLIKYFWQVI